jgi:hypothetical protein
MTCSDPIVVLNLEQIMLFGDTRHSRILERNTSSDLYHYYSYCKKFLCSLYLILFLQSITLLL